MSDTYIERIVKLIAEHRREIERLETALSVMSQLMEQEPTKKVKAVAANSGGITIRRIEPPERKEERQKPSDRESKNILRQKIIASLRKNGPQTSGTLIAEMFPKGSTKPQKQLIYAALSDWLRKGQVQRRPTGDYELMGEHTSH